MAQVQPSVVSLGGGLILNKDVFSMSPGEALQLRNFEPDIEGGYKKLLGTTKYNTNVCPQVSASTERVVFTAIFNDVVLAGRGGSIHRASSGSGSWTSTITGLGTPTRNYEFRIFNFDGTERIVITTGTSSPQLLTSGFSASVVNFFSISVLSFSLSSSIFSFSATIRGRTILINVSFLSCTLCKLSRSL